MYACRVRCESGAAWEGVSFRRVRAGRASSKRHTMLTRWTGWDSRRCWFGLLVYSMYKGGRGVECQRADCHHDCVLCTPKGVYLQGC